MGTCHAQIVQLQQKVGTADDKAQRLEASEQRLKERVRQLERSLEVAIPTSMAHFSFTSDLAHWPAN